MKSALERYPPPIGIQAVSDLSESLPEVKADPTQLDIVFGNLIRNAYDAMPAEGKLTVSGTQTTLVSKSNCGYRCWNRSGQSLQDHRTLVFDKSSGHGTRPRNHQRNSG